MSAEPPRDPGPHAGVAADRVAAEFDPELERQVRVQSYAPSPAIAGVAFHDLSRSVDDSGSLIEIARLAGGETLLRPGFEARQITYSILAPGAIKAFHVHRLQSELWFVPPEAEALVGLLDARSASPTRRASMRFVLGGGQARLLFIPAGVAHGIANPADRPCPLLYLADREFSPEPGRCDEHRLPWDLLGARFWERRRD